MSMFSKLIGIGVTAVAAVAAAKVAKKYMENKEADEFAAHGVELEDEETAEAPCTEDPVSPPEDGGEPEPEPVPSFEEKIYETAEEAKDVLDDVAKAAGDVWDETREKAASAAENAGVDTAGISEAFTDAGRALAQAGKAVFAAGSVVAHKVAEDAPVVLDRVKAQTGEWLDQVKNAVNAASEPETPAPQPPEEEPAAAPDEDDLDGFIS